MKQARRRQQPQPKDLKTHPRPATTRRAVAQGITHTLRRKHETQAGKRHLLPEASVKSILRDWPAPQKSVAQQMIAKYGLPNEEEATDRLTFPRRVG